MGDGSWEMEDGRWEMEVGRWEMGVRKKPFEDVSSGFFVAIKQIKKHVLYITKFTFKHNFIIYYT